jgi:hypothetical protein
MGTFRMYTGPDGQTLPIADQLGREDPGFAAVGRQPSAWSATCSLPTPRRRACCCDASRR